MRHAALARAVPSANGTASSIWSAWRDVDARALCATMLLGLLAFVLASAPAWKTLAASGRYAMLIPGLLFNQLIALCLLLGILAAHRAIEAGAPRARAYTYATVGGVAAGVVGEQALRALLHLNFALVDAIWRTCEWLLVGGFATYFHAHRRESLATLARLRAAELNRLARSREMLEARLTVMQARVEPRFLFNTLAQVRHLYATAPPVAEQMLEQLIAYLRAAMPKMRESASTLGQELELVRAYLAIVALRTGGRLRFSIDHQPALADATMPPMMLLPLVDHAVRDVEAHGPARVLAIRSATQPGYLEVHVDDDGEAFAPHARDEGLASIRERLNALYADAARLVVERRVPSGTRAVLQLPLQGRSEQ
jgi:signal transduction histidine kinase